MSKNRPGWYRSDEELFVYDQCCGNCIHDSDCTCPMDFDEDEKNICKKRHNEKKLREDAIMRDGVLQWCIYWKKSNRSEF